MHTAAQEIASTAIDSGRATHRPDRERDAQRQPESRFPGEVGAPSARQPTAGLATIPAVGKFFAPYRHHHQRVAALMNAGDALRYAAGLQREEMSSE